MKLTKLDYINILNFYNIKNIDSMNLSQIKNSAEDIIASKLCSCIKTIDPSLTNESKAIAICTKSIVKKKGLKINRFTCKKKPKLLISRKNKNKLTKKNKNKLTKKNKSLL